MNIRDLLSILNHAVINNSFSLTTAIPGLTWNADIGNALSTNLNVENIILTEPGLCATEAIKGSVTDSNNNNLPSVLLFGNSDRIVLNIPTDQLLVSLYISPVDASDNNSTSVYFTLIIQIIPALHNPSKWTPSISFPGLKDDEVFNLLNATSPPSFLLTSFVHNQQWIIGNNGATFTNSFSSLQTGLSLQVPCLFSTSTIPVLEALFGIITTDVIFFNGPVDNTKTSKNPNDINISVYASLGSQFNKSFTGSSSFNVEFFIGFKSSPVAFQVNDSDPAPTIFHQTQALLQAVFGNVIIEADVPLDIKTLSFSVSGMDNAPAISLGDIIALFTGDFLSSHLPQSVQQQQSGKSFFDYISIIDFGMTLDMSAGGLPVISNILLIVGYPPTAPSIGYGDWIALKDFEVAWFVQDPFSSNPIPFVSLSGDLELLRGSIAFLASFAKSGSSLGINLLSWKTQTSTWSFAIQGALRFVPDQTNPLINTNVIHLSDLFEQFSSSTKDFPEIDITVLSLEARPDDKYYAGSFQLQADYHFCSYTAPVLSGFGVSVTDDNGVITGSITALIAVGTASFAFIAARSATAWTFTAESLASFSMGDLAKAFGFKHPAYLDGIEIEKVNVSYVAPIKQANANNQITLLKANDAGRTSVFSIIIEAAFPIDHDKLEVDVTLSYTVQPDSWKFDAILVISPKGDLQHQLAFKFGADSTGTGLSKDTTLTATLKHPSGNPIHIRDIALALGESPMPLPDAVNELELTSLTFEYDTNSADASGLLFSVQLGSFGGLVFTLVKTGISPSVWKPFVSVSFTQGINFNELPVIGSHITAFGIVSLTQIQIAGLTKIMTAADLAELTKLLTKANVPTSIIPNAGTGVGLPAEAIFNAVLTLNTDTKPINLIFKSSNKHDIAALLNSGIERLHVTDDPVANIPENNSGHTINKSFGPVTLQQFNLAYTDGQLGIDVSGELSLAGIAMSFQGMGIKMKIPPKEISDISFQLHGLGINVNEGSLHMAGGFITLDDNFDNFMGTLAITAGSIGIQAFGGYATTTPQPSFFIFVNVEVPLGGPPFFFIDGVSGGFGFNRQFILPDFDELPTFPLLPGASNNPLPSGPPANLNDITQALTALAKYIPPKQGAYWIAAGLDFMSFEIIQVSAILEVTFGTSFQIGLLANAAMSIPVPAEPIAYINIDLEVDFDPDKGVLAVFGMLTPASYVFSGACHLSGGFAFFIWFKGEHEGDFLVTIGGYHPAFIKPAWYPAVPRLSITWDLGVLKITGQSYFALTSHMIMAGLELSAVFDIRIVKATFDAGFDFLLGWKPFFYEADAYININIELHILFTIDIHAGVDMNIWGPEFGGKAKVDLTIISFTIKFGSSAPTPPPIPWSEFKALLPNSYPKSSSSSPQNNLRRVETPLTHSSEAANFAVSQVIISKGLLQQLSQQPMQEVDLTDENKFNWLIDANQFQILISAGVPCNNFYFNNDVLNSNAAINARSVQTKLSPDQITYPGAYLKPDDLEKFYTNQNQGLDPYTLFAYEYPDKAENAWWNQLIQVGPVDIPSGSFNDDGSRHSGFTSTIIINLYQLTENGNSIVRNWENNIVVTLVSKNAAGALWSGQVTPGNGNAELNTSPTIPNTLFGIMLSPKLWHPLQTRPIDIYELLFQDGNNLCWPVSAASVVNANTFEQEVSSDQDTMQFNLSEGNTVKSQYRQLDSTAFVNLPTGQALVKEVIRIFGFDDSLTVNINADVISHAMYNDWPVMALLGEEDIAAQNQVR